ncbi:hypothetical protein BO70DRAFT_381282 [Aspergillus heteromorphus CBS 117.55]|uniref:Uncharacterized protein n=1 Tax=Aspergillus heteromorphus CBS 117.55 TaxID=1448321 RepID=A0A317VP85_9EURO|nr:uncharacterized protein BO70DRAFT_381282 [Aspergillus heteromorphus CBS 117.55]PWY75071.1 hypothetical protein BO70DRAFT_381282 [Aspergillus heteromorphus CBS 117.55]
MPNPSTFSTTFTIPYHYHYHLEPTINNHHHHHHVHIHPPSNLPNYTRHITTHNSSGLATIHSSSPAQWTQFEQGTFGFSVAYTTNAFPADLNNNTDINAHESLMTGNTLGLVNPNGTVCRVVDFAPDREPLMHRTRSLDYGIVLEGEIIMELDSGEKTLLKKGDIAVQRATMHAWRNPSVLFTPEIRLSLGVSPLCMIARDMGCDPVFAL